MDIPLTNVMPGPGDALSKLIQLHCKTYGFDLRQTANSSDDLAGLVRCARDGMMQNEEWKNCIGEMLKYLRLVMAAAVPLTDENYAYCCALLLRARANIDERSKK